MAREDQLTPPCKKTATDRRDCDNRHYNPNPTRGLAKAETLGKTTYRNPRSGSQFTVQAYSHSERPVHPIQYGWKEWREATQQARLWPVMTFLYLQPQQHKKQQSATQLPKFIVQPYNATAPSDCRSVLEEVMQGGWCAS
jgi:hypothetical protein